MVKKDYSLVCSFLFDGDVHVGTFHFKDNKSATNAFIGLVSSPVVLHVKYYVDGDLISDYIREEDK